MLSKNNNNSNSIEPIKPIKLGRSKTNIFSVSKLSKSYGIFDVFKDVSFSLNYGEKTGLVGANGVGKSTLLRIISGIEKKDDGEITLSSGVKIAYFPQEFLDIPVSDYLGETGIENFKKFLNRLGLRESFLSRKMSELSGGEKSKIALVKIASSPSDLFLLDEPTNNLDIFALEFLEDFVKKSSKTFLIISHDREFLDRTVEKIIEIDEVTQSSRIYDGGYTNYREIREARIEKEWADYEAKMKAVKKMKLAVEKKNEGVKREEQKLKDKKKLSYKITDTDKLRKDVISGTAGVLAREAKLFKRRMEKIDKEGQEKPKFCKPLKFSFEDFERSGDKVFEVKNVVKKYDCEIVFKTNFPKICSGNNKIIGPINLLVRYGERILVSGLNGAGKTTLIKMMLQKIAPDGGEIEIGSRIIVGYLPQESDFDLNSRVIDHFMKVIGEENIEEGEARHLLHKFNLTSEDISKKIGELSPGLKSRLILSILVAKKPNCLILDEPSNHLDLEVLEALENALKDFSGTLILVSHDRYFVNKIKVDRVFEMK